MQSNGNDFRNPRATQAVDALSRIIAQNVVYVREFAAADLKGEGVIPIDAPVPAAQKFFALCTQDGRKVAILDNRDLAFAAAREHELEPMSVH
jgi:hypothetical protein